MRFWRVKSARFLASYLGLQLRFNTVFKIFPKCSRAITVVAFSFFFFWTLKSRRSRGSLGSWQIFGGVPYDRHSYMVIQPISESRFFIKKTDSPSYSWSVTPPFFKPSKTETAAVLFFFHKLEKWIPSHLSDFVRAPMQLEVGTTRKKTLFQIQPVMESQSP